MSTGRLENDRARTTPSPPIDLGEQDAPAGPAWIVVPARVVAVVIVLPLRLVYDLVATVVLGVRRTPGRMGRLLRAAYMALLHPVFRLLAQGAVAIWSGLVWLWLNGVYGPVRWLLVVAIFGTLRLFGRGSGRLARWCYSVFLAPIVRLLAAIGPVLAAGLRMLGTGLAWLASGIGGVLNLLLVRPVGAVLHGLLWVLAWIGRGLVLAGKGAAVALRFLVTVLVVMPGVGLWRYLLRPPLLGLVWLAGVTASGLAWGWGLLATGVAALWTVFAATLVWSWRMLGRLLYWVSRILLVIPALALYRHLSRPIGLAVAGAWRLTGRGVRWLWRILVVAPSRAVRKAVLVPVGNGARAAWRVSVSEPARWVRRSVLTPIRETGRDVRLQVRRAFRGGRA